MKPSHGQSRPTRRSRGTTLADELKGGRATLRASFCSAGDTGPLLRGHTPLSIASWVDLARIQRLTTRARCRRRLRRGSSHALRRRCMRLLRAGRDPRHGVRRAVIAFSGHRPQKGPQRAHTAQCATSCSGLTSAESTRTASSSSRVAPVCRRMLPPQTAVVLRSEDAGAAQRHPKYPTPL